MAKTGQFSNIGQIVRSIIHVFLPTIKVETKPHICLESRLLVVLIISQFLAATAGLAVLGLFEVYALVGYIFNTYLVGLMMLLLTSSGGLMLGMMHGLSPRIASLLCVSNMAAVCLVLQSLYLLNENSLILFITMTMVYLSVHAVLGPLKSVVFLCQSAFVSLIFYFIVKAGLTPPFESMGHVSSTTEQGMLLVGTVMLASTLLLGDWLKNLVNRYYKHQAMHDELTGLVNRRYFSHRLMEQMASSKRSGKFFGVIYADLNDFKKINDEYGHAVGDMVLKGVGMALASTLRLSDVGARIGGDEFAILIASETCSKELDMMKSRIRDAINQKVVIEGQEVAISASLGASLFPDDAKTLEDLLENADQKMYEEKALKNKYCTIGGEK